MMVGLEGTGESVATPTSERLSECQACCSIEKTILNKLAGSTASFQASELSKSLGIRKSVLNNALYSLQRRGEIKHTSETPPLWAYDRNNDVAEREASVLDLLKKRNGPMSSHSIIWELQESKEVVNRILYDLEKQDEVERLQLSPPIWKVRKSQSCSSGDGSRKRHADVTHVSTSSCNADESHKKQRVEDPSVNNQNNDELSNNAAG
eukprot:scaffold168803_cov53-Attheya_sp.AAC.4